MTAASDGPSAELLSIGSELLAGDTVDTNAAFLGAALSRLGIPLRSVRLLPDDRATIAAGFADGRARVPLVVATGGLGPTHDDVTREGLADALGETLTADAALEAQLRERFSAYGPMPESNLRQALRIPSAEALANPIGSAPGWWVDRDDVVVVLMPGVPSEMRRMWGEQVAPRLGRRFALRPVSVRTVKTFGIGESALAELVGDLLTVPGDGIEAGIYAHDDGVHLRFWTRADPAALEGPVHQALAVLGQHIYGTDGEDLAGVTLAALARHGIASLASTESGTGGALLAILAETALDDQAVRYSGGLLLDGDESAEAPAADATLRLALGPADERGRSRIEVTLTGSVAIGPLRTRVHGSGGQRRRRAAFAALDAVRRSLR